MSHWYISDSNMCASEATPFAAANVDEEIAKADAEKQDTVVISLYSKPDFSILCRLLDVAHRNNAKKLSIYGNVPFFCSVHHTDQIRSMLECISKITSLTTLRLFDFQFDFDIVELVCDCALRTNLPCLDMSGTCLKQKGLQSVQKLVEKSKNLLSLTISLSSHLEKTDLESFSSALRRNYVISYVRVQTDSALSSRDDQYDYMWDDIVFRNRMWHSAKRILFHVLISTFSFCLPLYCVLPIVQQYCLLELNNRGDLFEYKTVETLQQLLQSAHRIREARFLTLG